MNFKLKYFFIGIFFLISIYQSFGQEIKISENLILHKLSEGTVEKRVSEVEKEPPIY